MKNLRLLLVLLPALIMTGCEEDNATPMNYQQEAAEGEWNLVNVSGSIAGVNQDFAPGTIAWTFNENGTVTVVNNNTNEQAEDFFDTGTYDYSFVANEDNPQACAIVLEVDNINFGCQTINGDELVLSQVWADGYQLTFEKQNQ